MSFDYSPLGIATFYASLGHELTNQPHPDGVFRVLTDTAVRHVSGAEYAGITRGTAGRFTSVAATDDLVLRTDRIQYELRSGPCVDAILEDAVFRARDLRTDTRWPEFGTRAFETTGVTSMLAYRLFLEDDVDLVAALNVYSTELDAFDETAQAIGLLLATHGALAIAVAAGRDRAHNLTEALKTSREIGVAMGVLMNQHKLTREQAFDLLRIASQHTNRKLADIAGEVADTGHLTLPARPTPGP